MACLKDDFKRPAAAMRKLKVWYDMKPLLGVQSTLVDREPLNKLTYMSIVLGCLSSIKCRGKAGKPC